MVILTIHAQTNLYLRTRNLTKTSLEIIFLLLLEVLTVQLISVQLRKDSDGRIVHWLRVHSIVDNF